MTSKGLALGFLPMQKLAVFALVLQRVWDGWLLLPRPCSLLQLASGASVLPSEYASARGQIILSQNPECMGKWLLGPVGSGKTLGEPREGSLNQPKAGTLGNILEMLTPGDTWHPPVPWLGKETKGSIYDGDRFC